MRCMVGMRMMNANKSSMKVFTNRKHRKRHGRCDTDLRWWLMNSWVWYDSAKRQTPRKLNSSGCVHTRKETNEEMKKDNHLKCPSDECTGEKTKEYTRLLEAIVRHSFTLASLILPPLSCSHSTYLWCHKHEAKGVHGAG